MAENTTAKPLVLRPLRALPPFRYYPLIRKTTLTSPHPNSLPIVKFTFFYPQPLGFSLTTHHIKLIRPGLHKPRSYTPITPPNQTGYLDLAIKIYPQGNSEWLNKLPEGSMVGMIGPLPFPLKKQIFNPGKWLGIIALGVGITSGFAVAREQLATDGVSVVLLHAVRYEADIVLQDEIEQLQNDYPQTFKLVRMASGKRVPNWLYGRINPEAIQNSIIHHSNVAPEDRRFHVVGTKAMIKSVWEMLNTIQYSRKPHALVRKPFDR